MTIKELKQLSERERKEARKDRYVLYACLAMDMYFIIRSFI